MIDLISSKEHKQHKLRFYKEAVSNLYPESILSFYNPVLAPTALFLIKPIDRSDLELVRRIYDKSRDLEISPDDFLRYWTLRVVDLKGTCEFIKQNDSTIRSYGNFCSVRDQSEFVFDVSWPVPFSCFLTKDSLLKNNYNQFLRKVYFSEYSLVKKSSHVRCFESDFIREFIKEHAISFD